MTRHDRTSDDRTSQDRPSGERFAPMRVETPRGAVVENPTLGRFELLRGGEVVSVALFHREGDRLIVPHVETGPAHRGNDYAAELMEGVMALVRATGRTVTPRCSWAAAYLRAHPEHEDLVD